MYRLLRWVWRRWPHRCPVCHAAAKLAPPGIYPGPGMPPWGAEHHKVIVCRNQHYSRLRAPLAEFWSAGNEPGSYGAWVDRE